MSSLCEEEKECLLIKNLVETLASVVYLELGQGARNKGLSINGVTHRCQWGPHI